MARKSSALAPPAPSGDAGRQLQIEWWDVERPKDYPRNARRWSSAAVEKVGQSLREYGFRQPVVVDAEGVICIGHLRRAAARRIGMKQIPVHVARDLTAAQIRGLRLMDNRSHEEATWDLDLLRPELIELKGIDLDLSLTGFAVRELDGLLRVENPTEDDVPPVEEVVVTKPGDLWLCGSHRVLCGNTTDAACVQRLCGGNKIQAMLADPPYGVGYTGGRGCVRKEFDNDSLNPEHYSSFLEDALRAWDAQIQPRAPLYMWFADRQGEAVFGAIRRAGWKKTAVIIWAKQHFIFSRAVQQYHQQHEPCVYATREKGLASWVGPMNETTLWNIARLMANKDHPTQKPVELYRRQITNSVGVGSAIGEMFLGSGSALIAAEETDRICYGTELAPEYADCIVRRWQNLTGKEATLDGADGRTFSQVSATRFAQSAHPIENHVEA